MAYAGHQVGHFVPQLGDGRAILLGELRANPALRRVAIAAVFKNPLAGKAAGADLQPLIDYSLELGVSLTRTALAALGSAPSQLRSYTKAALVGTGGDLEHGAAIVLWIGYGSGPRANARSKGPDQKEVDALIASFNND